MFGRWLCIAGIVFAWWSTSTFSYAQEASGLPGGAGAPPIAVGQAPQANGRGSDAPRPNGAPAGGQASNGSTSGQESGGGECDTPGGAPVAGGTGGLRPPTPGVGTGLPATARFNSPSPAYKKSASFEGALDWSWWWLYNGARYLNLKSVLKRSGTASVDVDLFDSEDGLDSGKIAAKAEQLRAAMIPSLRRAARDENAEIRRRAVLSLGRCGTGSEIGDLIDHLSDRDASVRGATCLALGMLGERGAANVLVAIAADSASGRNLTGRRHEIEPSIRAMAIYAIGLLGQDVDLTDTVAASTLLKIASTPNASSETNVAALTALGMMGSRDGVDTFMEILGDIRRPDEVRAQAAFALGRIGDRRALAMLVSSMRSKSPHIRRAVTIALGHLAVPGDGEVVDMLIRSLRSTPDRAQSQFAMVALAEIGGPAVKRFIADSLSRGSVHDRAWATLAAGLEHWHHGDESQESEFVAPILENLEQATHSSLRAASALSLGLLRTDRARDPLLDRLRDDSDVMSQACAAQALGLMRATSARDDLQRCLASTPNHMVRTAATIGLGLLGDRESLATLHELLTNGRGNAIVSSSIIQALGLVGDRGVVEQLGAYLDAREGVDLGERLAATTALGALGDRADVPALARFATGVNYISQTGALSDVLVLLN